MTLARRIIPCLDVKNGRVVKGVNFINLRDAGDPVACARTYDAQRADEITFLDISASLESRRTLFDVVERTSAEIRVPLTVGGGVRAVQDVRDLLNAGADKVGINTAALRDPALIERAAAQFGSQAIVVAIDAKRVGAGWRVFTHGGQKETDVDAVGWAQEVEKRGAGEILLTSMDRDGTQSGYDIELLTAVTRSTQLPVIASGGVGKLEHFAEGFQEGGASAALAASVFHDGRFSVGVVKEFLASRGICVRSKA